VRVCGHRGRHLRHRGTNENGGGRYWPIVAMPFWMKCVGNGYVR
jgi:hypothetical protein